MEESAVVTINSLLWTATYYSDVLKIDRRVVAQALEAVPSTTVKNRRVWHIRDAMPAIFRRVLGVESDGNGDDPKKLPPRDRLDHYRAERERLKLEQETRSLIPATEVEVAIGVALKAIAQALETLPDVLERDAALSPDGAALVRSVLDSERDGLYSRLAALTALADSEEPAE